MNALNRSTCALAFSLLSISTYGQVGFSTSKTYPTPDVGKLGEFGLMPPNPFNGRTNVSIPLYTVSYKDVNVPISISYSTSGHKVEEHPGIVGLGWTMQSGGMIYRRVNNLYDEHPRQTAYATYANEIGYYYTCGRVADNYNSTTAIKKYAMDPSVSYVEADYEYDASPDEFIFNFNGYSGVFYITRPHDNGPVELKVKPNGDYKLTAEIVEIKNNVAFDDFPFSYSPTQYAIRGASRSIYSIRITDDQGMQYSFGGNNNAVEFSNAGDFSHPTFNIASTWHLTEIISPNGYAVQFNYVKKGRTITPRRQRSTLAYSATFNFASFSNPFLVFSGEMGSTGFSYSGGSETTSYHIGHPSFLQSIVTPDQTLEFMLTESGDLGYDFSNYNTPTLEDVTNTHPDPWARKSFWQKLDAIRIDGGRRMIKFHYRNESGSRLRLDSLQIGHEKGGGPFFSSMNYRFLYNPTPLPAYGSRQVDHWGYYTGTSYAYGSNYYQQRNPNASFMKAEMLEEIRYPTGGYMKLAYEPHEFRKVAKQFPFVVNDTTANIMGGGLRVKSIATAPEVGGAEIKREYFYIRDYLNNGTHSSGIAAGTPQYSVSGSRRTSFKSGDFWGSTWGSLGMYYQKGLDNNFYTLASKYGDDFTYTEVVEKYGDNGYIRYVYTNYDNGYNDLQPYFMHSNFDSPYHDATFNTLGAYRGLPLRVETYTKDKQPLKLVEYSHSVDTSTRYRVPYFQRIHEPLVGGVRVSASAYYLRPPLKSTIVETEYLSPDVLKTERTFTYFSTKFPVGSVANDNYKPIEVSYKNSANETIEESFSYPYHFEGNPVYDEMLARNMVGAIVERSVANKTLAGKQLSRERQNYAFWHGNTRILPASTERSVGSDQPFKETVAEHYDSQGNVLQARVEADGASVSYKWGYGGKYPVAEVVNATNGGRSYALGTATEYGSVAAVTNQTSTVYFTVLETGPVTVTMNQGSFLGFSGTTTVACTLFGPTTWTQNVCMDNNPASSCYFMNASANTVTFPGMPPGDYSLEFKSLSTVSGAGITLSYSYRGSVPVGLPEVEVFYEGFEDDANGASASPYAGKRYKTGAYGIPFVKPNGKLYVVEYWFLRDGAWQHNKKTFTNGMTLNDGTAIDEVRVYPVDAGMTTRTFDTLFGVTSQTDASGRTIWFDYDDFGRLWRSRDHFGNVMEEYKYNYRQ